MKTPNLTWISLLLVAILSSCNLPAGPGSPTRTVGQNLTGTAVAMTVQSNPTQTNAPTSTAPTGTPASIATFTPPNTPILSAYNYTCELASGGGNMTMNLSWTDRSNSEESYKVYRDGQVIATLAPNTTFYVDVTYVAAGKTLSYSVEAFNENWQASTETIVYGCQ